ncbi:MAG: DUF2953 domain-containing protein [Clostridiales bacterium]|jgi:hypothetical protein|nr:DUF2953 domain-containing protein [Eubacteriales bacterium]MDH7565376.1 DUF2953 domain-containing protein [Clostridiales bacterium]
MLYLVIFILFLTAMAVLLYMIELNIILEYAFGGANDHATVTLSAFGGALRYKRELGPEGFKKKRKRTEKDVEKEKRDKEDEELREVIDKYRHFKIIYRSFEVISVYLRKKLRVSELRLNIVVGSEDAFYTGFLSGIAWSLAGAVVSFISNNFRTQKSNLNVRSEYMGKKLELDIYCIFIIKSVYIIVVGFKYLLSRWKEKKLSKR